MSVQRIGFTAYFFAVMCRVVDENGSLLQEPAGAIQDVLAIKRVLQELESSGQEVTIAAIAKKVRTPFSYFSIKLTVCVCFSP